MITLFNGKVMLLYLDWATDRYIEFLPYISLKWMSYDEKWLLRIGWLFFQCRIKL